MNKLQKAHYNAVLTFPNRPCWSIELMKAKLLYKDTILKQILAKLPDIHVSFACLSKEAARISFQYRCHQPNGWCSDMASWNPTKIERMWLCYLSEPAGQINFQEHNKLQENDRKCMWGRMHPISMAYVQKRKCMKEKLSNHLKTCYYSWSENLPTPLNVWHLITNN